MQKRKEEAAKRREEDYNEKVKELDNEINECEDEEEKKTLINAKQEKLDEWNEARDQQDQDEDDNDPDKPNLDEMKQKAQDEIQEQLQKDTDFLAEFCEALKEKKVKVIQDLETDVSAEFVHIKLLEKLKEHIQHRPDLIEREQCQALKESEVTYYERSYTYKHSKFGLNSPIAPYNPIKTKKWCVLYRERLYFPSTAW